MRNSLKIVFVATGICLFSLTAFRLHNYSTPEQRAQQWTEWMKKELKLNAAQLVKVQAINLTYAQKAELLKKKEESNIKKFKELQAFDKLKDADLQSIFTKEQFQLYLEKKKTKQKEMLHHEQK